MNLRNKVKQSESGIDVYLNQRFDLIPNLVECVKAYSKHEQSIFTEIAALRTGYMNKYSLETHLNRLLSKKVWLKSGAYLIIEPTEALTVIDVNTGKADLKTNKEGIVKLEDLMPGKYYLIETRNIIWVCKI